MKLSPKQKESRPIKFRAWVGGEIISWEKMLANPYFADFFRLTYMTNPPRPVAELMQFTGLTDKNGREIYEGDIIKYQRHGSMGWVIQDPEIIEDIRHCNHLMDDTIKAIEVIGNLYENPELLNTKP